jgi:carbonic anhydrase/acetyltransferase-like protein (isoleucine patch superfamily)
MSAIRPFNNVIPQIADSVYVDQNATVIGQVSIDEDASVWPGAVIRGDVQSISIGKRTSVQDGAVLHVTHDGPYSPGGRSLVIGDDVTIGHNATLHACTVGNACLIGMSATILDGATLGDNVMLAAGSLVSPNMTLESGYLYRGVPAKKARKLTKKELEFLTYSTHHYVKLKNQYKNQS